MYSNASGKWWQIATRSDTLRIQNPISKRRAAIWFNERLVAATRIRRQLRTDFV
jgi:hypothetical protein